MVFCFDIDGTLCTHTMNYKDAEPITHRIDIVNELYDQGHRIVLFTARGATTGIDWYDFTESQLKQWGVRYHELRTDKPYYDIIIDDKAVDDASFFDIHVFDLLHVDED